jgi:hypothetical protein
MKDRSSVDRHEAEGRKRSTGSKQRYEAPRVLASYDKEELDSALQVEGQSGGGCGCGCGSILQ